jgi:hypothetical protein
MAWYPGVVIFLLVGLWWFVTVGIMHEGLLSKLVREEVAGRVTDADFNRNPQWYGPLAVIILPFVAGLGPWLFYWRRAWTTFRSWGGTRARLRALRDRDALVFCALWAFIPVAILCLPRSRLPLYVLPFVPALALLTGRAAVVSVAERGWGRFLRLGIATALVMLFVKGLAPSVPSRSDVRPVYEFLRRQSAPRGFAPGSSVPSEELHVFGYGLEQEYGLQFYLDGNLTRVLDVEGAMRPEELFRLLSDASREEPAYVVARALSERFESELTRVGLAFERGEAGSYSVFTVPPLGVQGNCGHDLSPEHDQPA